MHIGVLNMNEKDFIVRVRNIIANKYNIDGTFNG